MKYTDYLVKHLEVLIITFLFNISVGTKVPSAKLTSYTPRVYKGSTVESCITYLLVIFTIKTTIYY